MLDLQTTKLYRIAYNTSRRELRGVIIYFLEMVTIPNGIQRAKIRVVGTQETYLVSIGQIIPF